MSKFPNQLALVSLATVSAVALAVGLHERAAYRAEIAHEAELAAAEAEASRAAAEAALAARQAAEEEAAAEEAVAEAPAAAPAPDVVADAAPEADAPAPEEVADAAPQAETGMAPEAVDAAPHGHGDPGTAPIRSIIAGAAVAQSVDSPAIDATGVDYELGRRALPEEIDAWNIDVRPDGTGLPEGSGDVWTGEEVFVEQCAVCHGDFAEGVGRWPVLAGGEGSLTNDRPVKTIGSYWPYLSTVFDYVNRAMPFGNAQSLTPDEVYAITAYLLYSNYLVEDDFTLSHENFTDVRLPNEDGFFMDDREETEIPAFTREPCMEDCKDEVEITMRAVILDVTPEDGSDPSGGMDLEGGGGAPAPAPAAAEEPATAAPADQAPAEEAEAEAGEAPEEMAALETDAPEEAPAEEVSVALDPALVAEGERAFRQCRACHMVGENAANRVGPHLNDVMGRTAGAVEGFRYSNVMADAGAEGLVWTEETLHDFLVDPRGYLRGTKMSFNGFRDEEDIAAVTAYLQSFSQ